VSAAIVEPATQEPYDLVAKAHAEEISTGLRDIAGAIGDAFTHLEPSAAQSGSTVRFDPVNVADGLLAVARALERIAAAMERKS
jgi:hypothetical protein